MEDYLKLYIWEWLNTILAMVTIIINMANNNNPAGALIPLLLLSTVMKLHIAFSSFYAVPMRVCKVNGLVGFYGALLQKRKQPYLSSMPFKDHYKRLLSELECYYRLDKRLISS